MLDEVIRLQRELWQRIWLQIGAGGLWGCIIAIAVHLGDSQLVPTWTGERGSGLLNTAGAAVLGSFGVALAMHLRSWSLVSQLPDEALGPSAQAQGRLHRHADILARLRFFDSAVALTAVMSVALGVAVLSVALMVGEHQWQAASTLAMALLLTLMLGEAGGVPLSRLGDYSAQIRQERSERLARCLRVWNKPQEHMTERVVRARMTLHVALGSGAGCLVVLLWAGLRHTMGMDPLATDILPITCVVILLLGPMDFLYLRLFALTLMDQQVLLAFVSASTVLLGNATTVSMASLWPGPAPVNALVLTVSAAVVLAPYLMQLLRPKAALWTRIRVVPALEITIRRRIQQEIDELDASGQSRHPKGVCGRWYWRLTGRPP